MQCCYHRWPSIIILRVFWRAGVIIAVLLSQDGGTLTLLVSDGLGLVSDYKELEGSWKLGRRSRGWWRRAAGASTFAQNVWVKHLGPVRGGRFCRVRQIPLVDGRMRNSNVELKRDNVQFYHFHFLFSKFSFCLFLRGLFSAWKGIWWFESARHVCE